MAGLLLGAVGILLFGAGLLLGSVPLTLQQVLSALRGDAATPDALRILVLDSRLPRTLTAMGAGAGLGASGLLMQSFFRNPVAGPYILGISSGASLGVALLLLGGMGWGLQAAPSLVSAPSLVLAAGAGAGLTMGLMMLLAGRLRDPATLLIFGLMLGSFTGALVGILQYYAGRDALRDFVYWTFGSLEHAHWAELSWLLPLLGLCLLLAWLLQRPFDLLALGEDYARSSGLPLQAVRLSMLGLTALLAGSVTATCGPIAFIGVAVPHAARALSGRVSHGILVPLSALAGADLLMACDLISRLPGMSGTLPINAVTALLGAPAVWLIVWRSRRVGRFFGA